MIAEQQRAKTEIEAALTVASAKPRDERSALDAILVSCQRPRLAEKAQYEYSRGGTAITGPSIVLMEMIAQKWGNVVFGFRELARYPGQGGRPGESVTEAFAWDLQTNVKRAVQFSVEHSMKSGKGQKGQRILTDPRDIYEYVANQAQRRVRTCLENIIPRDIIEEACDECDRTLKAAIQDVAKVAAEMLAAFEKLGVTKGQIETRLQRRFDSITPAQIIGMRKIYASIRDGISEPSDWFDMDNRDNQPSAAPMNKAKEAMRERAATKKQPPKPGAKKPTAPETAQDEKQGDSAKPPAKPLAKPDGNDAAGEKEAVAMWMSELDAMQSDSDNPIDVLKDALNLVPPVWSDTARDYVTSTIKAHIANLSRGNDVA